MQASSSRFSRYSHSLIVIVLDSCSCFVIAPAAGSPRATGHPTPAKTVIGGLGLVDGSPILFGMAGCWRRGAGCLLLPRSTGLVSSSEAIRIQLQAPAAENRIREQKKGCLRFFLKNALEVNGFRPDACIERAPGRRRNGLTSGARYARI